MALVNRSVIGMPMVWCRLTVRSAILPMGCQNSSKNGGTVAVTPAGAVVTSGVGQHEPANGLACTTCHSDLTKFHTVRPVTNVPFPSGKSVTFSKEKDDKGALKPVAANLCLECHQGRDLPRQL